MIRSIIGVSFLTLAGLVFPAPACAEPSYDYQTVASPNDAVLLFIRTEQLEVKSKTNCLGWVGAIPHLSAGRSISLSQDKKSYQEWEPWTDDDDSTVLDCDKFPCKIKLDAAEVRKMKEAIGPNERSLAKTARKRTFLSLVSNRVSRYEKSGERKEYEFSGDPVDPWLIFDKQGLGAKTRRSTPLNLSVKKLDFAPGKMRPLRQVLDRRVAFSPKFDEVTMWIRDVYTSHYFDSWGEWMHISCDQKTLHVNVKQALLLEVDLLKQNDPISILFRSRMRSSIHENAKKYLDQVFSGMKAVVGE